MDENKTMSIAVLGVVAVIAVVSVVLLMTNTGEAGLAVRDSGVYYTGGGLLLSTPSEKVYGGDAKDNSYPCRLVNGKVGTCQNEVVDTATPYKTYGKSYLNIPSTQTACGNGEQTVDGFNQAHDFETRYDVKCRKLNSGPDGRYCCPLRDLAKGTVIE